MIRLDGNSLAAFRGAGVAGTVQSVAGCELFGAARVPSWASPYSAAATAALKAQFPTQWPTIRDYGFSHPEIVGYMNAYAPEDAKIAYSLVEGIGRRLVLGNGNNYATSHIYGTNKTRVIFKGKLASNSNNGCCPFGAEVSYNSRAYDLWLRYVNDTVCYNNGYRQGMGATPTEQYFTIDANKEHWTNVLDNGTTVWDVTFSVAADFVTPTKLALLAATRNGSPIFTGTASNVYGESWICYENGTLVGYYIPFKRNGQMELLDLVSGNLATRVGTFTELIESPA